MSKLLSKLSAKVFLKVNYSFETFHYVFIVITLCTIGNIWEKLYYLKQQPKTIHPIGYIQLNVTSH